MPAASERKMLHHGRIMKCLSFLLLFPETLKKSKKAGKHSSKLPTCYDILTHSLKKKMAAELYPANLNVHLSSDGLTNANASDEEHVVSVSDTAHTAVSPTTRRNNNVDISTRRPLHPTLRERNALMFNNELMADVHFVVGAPGELHRVPAHKYVLALGSSVFCAMFYGDLAEEESDIRIPDVEPAAFLILLRYMYSDEIELEADTVVATLYAAKKYLVSALARACVAFLETSLEARNACVLLSQSRLFEEPELTQRCWEVIDAQAELALGSETFSEIDRPTLESILCRETLNAKEAVVFQASVAWAEAECRRRGLFTTAANKRLALADALYSLRLPAMSLEEFADGPAQSDVLTLEETRSIFLWYTAATKPELPFPLAPRPGLTAQRCRRFQSCAYRSNQWRYRGRCDSVQFATDRRVFLAGLGLYGANAGPSEYGAWIELKRQGATLARRRTAFTSDGSSSAFEVRFEQPVRVEPDVFYTVSATLEGSELSYFGQEGMTEVQCGKVTFQFQCSSDSTNGTGVQGGQIPELVFYA